MPVCHFHVIDHAFRIVETDVEFIIRIRPTRVQGKNPVDNVFGGIVPGVIEIERESTGTGIPPVEPTALFRRIGRFVDFVSIIYDLFGGLRRTAVRIESDSDVIRNPLSV